MCACAGALVAENPTGNLLTRMQGWDYRLGINGVKRMQAAYNSALVAQGAFSAYWTDDIRAVGGWPDAIGEDIVLTWTLMDSRGLVQYEPCALGVHRRARPGSAHFMRQRRAGRAGCSRAFAVNPPTPAAGAGQVRRRDRLPRPAARHRLRLLLDPGRDPLHLRLPADVLVVVDARDPDHAGRLRAVRRWQERNVFRRLDVHPEHDAAGSSATCSATRR